MADLLADQPFIAELIKPVIDTINYFLSKLVPEGEIWILLIVCFTIGFVIKKHSNWNNLSFILFSLILFGGLRYISLGG